MSEDFQVIEHPMPGQIEISGSIDPVSLQGDASRRAKFKADLGAAVAQATSLVYLGDVEVTVEWYVSEKRRYETHIVADIDNVLKPLLDAVTGHERPLIDDNQVQSIRITWLDGRIPDVKFRMTMEPLMPDEFTQREGLFFVELTPTRCYPLFERNSRANDLIVEGLRRSMEAELEMLNEGIAEEVAGMVRPIQRSFPRARLGKFVVKASSEFATPNVSF